MANEIPLEHYRLFLTTVPDGFAVRAIRVDDKLPLEHYREFFAKAPIGLAICEKATAKYVDVNEAFADLLGMTVSEVLACDYWQITPEKYKKQEQEQLTSLKETGRYGPYEKEYNHKDHTEAKPKLVPVRLSGRIIEAGGIEYIWSVVNDLREEKYRVLFRTAQIGLALCDMDGNFIDVNQAFADIVGRSIGELENMRYWQITDKRFLEKELDVLKRLNGDGRHEGHYGPLYKWFIKKDKSPAPVELWGHIVEFGRIPFIWSIIREAEWGGEVGDRPDPSEIESIEPEPPAEEVNLSLNPIKP